MKNITKLSIWPELSAQGFIPINFNTHGRKVAIGAALQRSGSDVICIEPKYYTDKSKNYFVTGTYSDNGNVCAAHVGAREILSLISDLRK